MWWGGGGGRPQKNRRSKPPQHLWGPRALRIARHLAPRAPGHVVPGLRGCHHPQDLPRLATEPTGRPRRLEDSASRARPRSRKEGTPQKRGGLLGGPAAFWREAEQSSLPILNPALLWGLKKMGVAQKERAKVKQILVFGSIFKSAIMVHILSHGHMPTSDHGRAGRGHSHQNGDPTNGGRSLAT